MTISEAVHTVEDRCNVHVQDFYSMKLVHEAAATAVATLTATATVTTMVFDMTAGFTTLTCSGRDAYAANLLTVSA